MFINRTFQVFGLDHECVDQLTGKLDLWSIDPLIKLSFLYFVCIVLVVDGALFGDA
jgi:hypothetical protein